MSYVLGSIQEKTEDKLNYVQHSIKNNKTVGVINEDQQTGIIEIAEPVGVIAGVTPTTNPTSTTLFKAIIAIKTRNPIIFAFHPSAQNPALPRHYTWCHPPSQNHY